jgi:hypothetical protein
MKAVIYARVSTERQAERGTLTASYPKSCPAASQSRHSVSLMAPSQGWISMCVFSCWCGADLRR